MLPIATVENAVLARLRAALPHAGVVGPYAGELDGETAPLPAVWVDFLGATAARTVDTAGRCWRTELEFSTIAAAATSLDADGVAGTYRLLDEVAKTLATCDLGLQGVGRMKPGVIAPFATGTAGNGVNAYAQRWSVVCEYALVEEEAPLRTVSLAYRVHPSAAEEPVVEDSVQFPI